MEIFRVIRLIIFVSLMRGILTAYYFLLMAFIAERQYSAVMFDMDNKDRSLGLSCPPPQFLDAEVMAHVHSILVDDGEISFIPSYTMDE